MVAVRARLRATSRQPHLGEGRDAHASRQLPSGVYRLRQGGGTGPIHRSASYLREGLLEPGRWPRQQGKVAEPAYPQGDSEQEGQAEDRLLQSEVRHHWSGSNQSRYPAPLPKVGHPTVRGIRDDRDHGRRDDRIHRKQQDRNRREDFRRRD